MIALLRGDKDATAKTIEHEHDKRTNVSTIINALELFIGIVAVDGVSGKRIEATRDFISTITHLARSPLSSGRG